MAGKSTIMRSTIAVTLLGSCGLLGPARAAQVPYIDAFMLRTFSADAPIEGRSSFAVEMVEMRCALLPCVSTNALHKVCKTCLHLVAVTSATLYLKDLHLRHVQMRRPNASK